jgi:small-conductance mechanosensitive channel
MDFEFLYRVFLGNRIIDYLVSLSALVLGLLVVKVFVFILARRFSKSAVKSAAAFDGLLARIFESIIVPALFISCFYISVKMLKMPAGLESAANIIELGLITLFAARLAVMLLEYVLKLYLSKKGDDITLMRSLDGMFHVVKYLVWAIALIIFLDNTGFKVSTIIAGLGVGGVAVAISAQTLLKDFFSYFSIVFDKPF